MSYPLFALSSSAIAAVTLLAVCAFSGRRWLAILAAFAGATALLIVHGPLYFDYYADDAFITLRYSQHFADGLGPNWNSEGRVEGYTTFLWMGTLAGLAKLGFDLVEASRVLGFAAVLATFGAVWRIWRLWAGEEPASGLASPVLPAAVLLGLSLTDGIAFWGFSGMETPLFMALLTWSAYAILRERRHASAIPWSALLLAATAMTRPEGLIAAAVTGLFVLFDTLSATDRRRAVARACAWGGVFLAIYGSYFAWRFSYYGYLFPNTFYAKVGLNMAAIERGIDHVLSSGLEYHLAAMLAGLAALAALAKVVSLRRDAAYLAALTSVMLAGVVVEGGDTHIRFISPLLPLLFLGGLAGFATLLGRAALPRPQTLAVTALALTLGGLALLPASEDPLLALGRDGIDQRRQLGVWLNENTPPDYTIADFAIGATAYYAIDRDFLDLLGLNDVVIAHTDVPDFGGGIMGHEKYNVDYVYDEVRPEIIVVAQVRREPLTADELQQAIRETSLIPASYLLLTDERLWRDYEVRALEIDGRWLHLLQRSDTVAELQAPDLR